MSGETPLSQNTNEQPRTRPLSQRRKVELELAHDLSQLRSSPFLELLCDAEGIEIAAHTRPSLGLESK